MESDPHPWIAALRRSHGRLVATVQPLDPEQIRQRSYHDWTIAQVLSHLGSGAELGLGWLEAAVAGREPPGRETFPPVWDAWNARTPEQQVTDGIAYDERYVERWESLTDDELARMRLNLFGMDLDAVGLAGLRLGEHALHTWDVVVALDPSAQVAPDAVALLIDRVPQLAGFAGKPQGKPFRLRVVTIDPEREFTLQVDDAVSLTPGSDGSVDGELRLPAEAFLRLVYGRMDPDHTPPYELTAQNVDLDDLRAVFPGV